MAASTLITDHLRSQALSRLLSDKLSDIFDAHGVCATIAQAMNDFTGTATVVALAGPEDIYYDVWVSHKGRELAQHRWPVESAFLQGFINRRQAVDVRRTDLSPEQLSASDLWPHIKTWVRGVALPFRPSPASITPHGVLCLLDHPEEHWLDQDNFERLARQLSPYLDRAYLRQKYTQQQIEFQVVSDISFALTATLNIEEVYEQLAEPLRRILNVESVSIGLADPDTDEIVFVGSLLGPLFKDMPAIRLKRGQGIAGWVAEHGQPLIVNDVQKDARFYSKIDQISGFNTGAMLCVPLRIEQRVIGILEVINKKVGRFNEADLRLVQAISGPLAAAIENAALHTNVLAEKSRIQTIIASMSEGLLTIDAYGRVTAANDSMLTLLHCQLEDLLGTSAIDVVAIRDGDLAMYIAEVMFAEGEYPQLACEVLQRSGVYVPVLVGGAPIRNEEGEVSEAILVFSDLSEIREIERMRDDFFHNIVHELRTPLATILMYARLLRDGKARDDRAKIDRFLGVIERESDRLQTMVRQMLQLAKLEARHIQRGAEPVHLNALFEQLIPQMADQARHKGLAFKQTIQPEMPPIFGDRETLHIIFKNLLENAVKFTLEGGVTITAKADGDEVCVAIHDDGIGIPEAALPNLFRRFYRASTAVEKGIAGTGLGLYMVKESIDVHQGRLDVTSQEGQGTTFTVFLPINTEMVTP